MSWNLGEARKYAVGLIAAAAGVGVSVRELQRIRELPHTILNYGYMSCFVLVGLLVFIWIWATESELGFQVWLYPKKSRLPSGTQETAQIMLVSATLVALFYATRNALLLSEVFAFYSTLVCLVVFRMNAVEFTPILADSRNHLMENPENWTAEIVELRQKALTVLNSYFLVRPHTPRHVLILFFAFIACQLAVVGELKNLPYWSLAAYGVIFVAILVSELVIANWRILRDRELRSIDESLKGMGHDIEKLP